MRLQASERDMDTDALVEQAASGVVGARDQLLARHRERLRKMVAVRIDPRLAQRVDPSDVVQETLVEADKRLDAFFVEKPIAFYPWLRGLAWQKLIDVHRRHIQAQRRSVEREQPWELAMSDASAMLLADRLQSPTSSPSRNLLQEEIQQRVKQLLAEMSTSDREIIVMRHLEGMSVKEIAAVLGMPEGTIKSRHFRALQSLKNALSKE